MRWNQTLKHLAYIPPFFPGLISLLNSPCSPLQSCRGTGNGGCDQCVHKKKKVRPTIQVCLFFASSTEQPCTARTHPGCILELHYKFEDVWLEKNGTQLVFQWWKELNAVHYDNEAFLALQSLAKEADSFSWPQLEHSLKTWLGEADFWWHGLSMLLEVWKVQVNRGEVSCNLL